MLGDHFCWILETLAEGGQAHLPHLLALVEVRRVDGHAFLACLPHSEMVILPPVISE